MNPLTAFLSGIGRILFASYFIYEASFVFSSRNQITAQAEGLRVPLPEFAVWWIVAGLGLACLLLILGMGIRLSGAILLAYVLGYAYFHGRYWLLDPGMPEYAVAQGVLLKSCALAGGALLLLGNGGGVSWKAMSRRDDDREMVH
jgi:uncharacterized membrane protein YphA (DoxX/SURF4 family)